jgi:hypothetical protein
MVRNFIKTKESFTFVQVKVYDGNSLHFPTPGIAAENEHSLGADET